MKLLIQSAASLSRRPGCLLHHRAGRPRVEFGSKPAQHLGAGTPLQHNSSYSSAAAQAGEEKPTGQKRSVIVTGASRGIGRAVAVRLARDGYDVCVNDIPAQAAACEEVAAEIRSLGRQAHVGIADVSSRDQVRELVQSSVQNLGPLSTMIANAGILQVKPLLELTEADFARVFAVNVYGVHNCFAEAGAQMIRQGDRGPARPGKLLAASSIAGFRPFALLPHYCVSKWAVRGLTQAYAAELGPHHITANSYAPGIISTPMWEQIDAGISRRLGSTPGDAMAGEVRGTALRRAGAPDDVVGLVSFLASPASDFITGQTQIVDGGIVFT
ncbi:hypothetical protein GGS23DRAFT_576634 [Durotheca rogersii]|uniref:uncharacterized protein n=1 Tax=Durotheca rogersii TaxID=419775 RepID=UPI002220B415|nr:uncharacterized protein GGS23DRAFT_576634 [Durotheca rogersii]KAI5861403.1 hypothetical protein GGS23DRAFT_576634 [Durotheca rogersii]